VDTRTEARLSSAAAADGIEAPPPRITRQQESPIVNSPPPGTPAALPAAKVPEKVPAKRKSGGSRPPPPPVSLPSSNQAVATAPNDVGLEYDSVETEVYTQSKPLQEKQSRSSADRSAARRRRRKRKREKEKKKAVTRARYWALGCLGLVVLVGLQVRLFYLDTLFTSSQSQPIAGIFCRIFSCPTPLPRDLGLLQINNTVVGNHPDVPSAIRISTTVSNVAEHDQPYPNVQLTLTDPNGTIISRRTFSPGQYVPDYVAGQERLQSAETTTFQFDINNPSKKAIGFEVELIQ